MVPMLVPSSAIIWNSGFSPAVISRILQFCCSWSPVWEKGLWVILLKFLFWSTYISYMSPFPVVANWPSYFAFSLGVVLSASFIFEIVIILSAYGNDYCWMTIHCLECLNIGFGCFLQLIYLNIIVWGMLFIWQLMYQVYYILLSNSNVYVWHHSSSTYLWWQSWQLLCSSHWMLVVHFASSNFLLSSVQNSVKVSAICLKWLSSDLYLYLWLLPFGCILSLNLCSTKSPFSHSSSAHLYFLRN